MSAEPLSVLVVDDDEGARSTVVEILAGRGIRAHPARDAAEALALASRDGIGVAVLDHRLPDSTGIEVAAQLKAMDPDLVVLLVTGYATLENAIAAVGQVDEFLTKPVKPEELTRRVQSALESRRLRWELDRSMAERTVELDGLTSFAEALGQAQGLDQVLSAVARAAVSATGARWAGVTLAPDDDRPAASWPEDGGPDGTATIAVPMTVGDERIGTLAVVGASRTSGAFLSTFTGFAGVAIQNAQRFAREKETVAQLEELSRMKSAFLASVSHELRTPLTAVVGFAQTLASYEHTLSEADRRQVVDRMVAQGSRLRRLINNLLDSTSIETGALRINPRPVDLPRVVDRVVDAVADGPVRINLSQPSHLPFALGDEGRLEQVVANLLDNAVKHSSPGDVVDIGLSTDDGHINLTVADHGSGIDPAFMPYLFDPFTQADGLARDAGVGLGLYIVRGLVEAMAGSIEVDSEVGQGARFTVTLPSAPTTT